MYQPSPKPWEDNQAQQSAHLAYLPVVKHFHRLYDFKELCGSSVGKEKTFTQQLVSRFTQ